MPSQDVRLERLDSFAQRHHGLVSRTAAAANGVALGDMLSIEVNGRRVPARVVGLLRPADDVTRRALNGILFTDLASAQEMLDLRGKLSHIDLIAADAALAPVSAVLPVGVAIETAAARQNAIQQMTAAFEFNLAALSMLALVVGMFLVLDQSADHAAGRKLFDEAAAGGLDVNTLRPIIEAK